VYVTPTAIAVSAASRTPLVRSLRAGGRSRGG
jgi:hypothetical protein